MNKRRMLIFYPLFYAGNVETAELLMKNGATIDTIDFTGSDQYLLSHLADKSEMVKWLISNGANLNVADSEGWTLLHLAATNGMNINEFKQV